MASRTDGHQDQASTRQAGIPVGAAAATRDRPLPSTSLKADHRIRPERRRVSDGLGFGAPLTAAFVGGLLIIENLADADPLDESQDASLPDETLALDGEPAEDSDGTSEPGARGRTSADGEADGGRADDPAAAPVEDPSLQLAGADGGSAEGLAAVAAATANASTLEQGEAGGGDSSVMFLNINVGDGLEEGEVDGFVEDEILERNRQIGTPGDDVIYGTPGDDSISGGSGDDIIFGGDGRDLLNGNEGDDQLFGGAGNDTLKGGAGNDLLDGGADYDNLLGGSGDDILIINNLHDVALDYARPANSGEDLLIVRQGYSDELLATGISSSTFFFSSENTGDRLPSGVASHPQQVAVGIEHLTLEGTASHDIVADGNSNRLTGNSGDNRIFAGDGDDRVSGGAGNDILHGGDGDDEIFGGSGNDIIEGGLGEDMLYGDAGDDLFLFGLSDSAVDTVFDHQGANRLKIEGVTGQNIEAALLGDDLYVLADDAPVAKVRDYVGHEDAIAGIDFGQGLRSVDSLLTNRSDVQSIVDEAQARAEEAASNDLLSAHLHLKEPTIVGAPRTDQRLDGTEGDDWLSGFDGKDVLFGHEGNDILAGGNGVDDLRGGAGNDRYLFEAGEKGIDKISDTEGRNLAELKGYDRAKIEGAMLGDDLAVLADGEILFTVKDFASNQASFEGVQAGNKFIPTEDLLA